MQRLCASILLGITLVGSVMAQEYRATVLGTVIDPSGAAVPESQIKLTNLETGVSLTAKSGAEGSYLIPYVQPGQYKLRVEHAGFRAFEQSPVELRVND